MGAVVDQVRKLVTAGYKEVVLTGIDITSYGPDLPGQPSLGQLVRRLLKQVPELPRLRLSSIDSIEIDDHLIRAIAEEDRLMPHLHLSLQSGSDMILKRMKRRHSRADAIEFCRKARELRPDIAFGADIIAGFPTETNEMFEDSLRLIEECGLKGYQIGGAQVSDKHANFIMNIGGATAENIEDLIFYIQKEVLKHKKISLETEIKIVGDKLE